MKTRKLYAIYDKETNELVPETVEEDVEASYYMGYEQSLLEEIIFDNGMENYWLVKPLEEES
jgi:hypothetical protein